VGMVGEGKDEEKKSGEGEGGEGLCSSKIPLKSPGPGPSLTLKQIVAPGYIAISGYPSMSHLFVDIFFEFGVVGNSGWFQGGHFVAGRG